MFPCCQTGYSDMSYILEALKKVDRERGMGDVPDLATPHQAGPPPIRSHRWRWISVLLLGINAVLVFMLLRDRDAKEANVPVSAEVIAEPQPAPIADSQPQPVQPSSQALQGEAPAPENPVLPDRAQPPSSGGLVMLPEPAYVQNPEPSMLPEETSDTQTDEPVTAEEHSPLQSWYELPEEIRSRIDLPRLDVHVYSEDPRKRFIMISLEKFHEGDRLPGGLVLEEILPDGMVLSYQGERFLVGK